MFSSGGPPSCSERRALRLQELGLLGRGLPAQDPIPVWEPPEPLDYIPVPCGVGGYVGGPWLVRKPPEQLDGAALVLPVLAVHERHVQEHPLEGRELPVQRVLDGVPGGLERRCVGGVGASVATEHVTGELVRDPGVELGVFAEPLVAKLAVARLACAAEPEVEYFVGLTRHGLLPLRLRRGGGRGGPPFGPRYPLLF